MKFSLIENEALKQAVDNMSFEELLYAVTCPDICPDKNPDTKNNLSVFMHPISKEYIKDKVKEVYENRRMPLLLVADFECCAGSIIGDTVVPSLMACGMTDNEELIYEVGKLCALEARSAGFGWTLAPCVDIMVNADNPITSLRSAGTTAEWVLKITRAYMKGVQENGLIATLKHFPGDGFSTFDQHLTTSVNSLSLVEWEKQYGLIYKTLIEDGVKAVMPGHISLPCYDEKDETLGLYPPASLSKRLLTRLLKEKLGFEGIIISDATNMGGFCGFMNYYKACATFLEAGGDCLLFTHVDNDFINAMKKMVENGTTSLETLKNRAYRMMCFVEQHKEIGQDIIYDKEYHKSIADKVAEKSITLVRDREGLIPFKMNKKSKILYAVIENESCGEKGSNAILSELKKHCNNVTQVIDAGPEKMLQLAKSGEYDLIICSIGCKASYGTSVIRLHGPVARNMMSGWMKYDTPVIFVSQWHPRVHNEFEASIGTIINTYGNADRTAEYLVDSIIGKRQIIRTDEKYIS